MDIRANGQTADDFLEGHLREAIEGKEIGSVCRIFFGRDEREAATFLRRIHDEDREFAFEIAEVFSCVFCFLSGQHVRTACV